MTGSANDNKESEYGKLDTVFTQYYPTKKPEINTRTITLNLSSVLDARIVKQYREEVITVILGENGQQIAGRYEFRKDQDPIGRRVEATGLRIGEVVQAVLDAHQETPPGRFFPELAKMVMTTTGGESWQTKVPGATITITLVDENLIKLRYFQNAKTLRDHGRTTRDPIVINYHLTPENYPAVQPGSWKFAESRVHTDLEDMIINPLREAYKFDIENNQ